MCGRRLKDDKFDYCYDCNQKIKNAKAALPENYLSKGYFDEKGHLYVELVTSTAEQVAKAMGNDNPALTNSQLRRFFGHARAADNRLNMDEDFNSVNIDIQKLRPFVAEARGKGKVPKSFYDFIDKNLELVKDLKSFKKGFMEHFQAVVAYFYYHFPKNN
jgi:CRISPR-associated protein Csm2